MTQENYCEDIIMPGTRLYYSLRFSPKSLRPALFALYALQIKTQEIIYQLQEHSIIENKLTWWLQEIENLYQQKPAHPITKILLPWVIQYALPKELFLSSIYTTLARTQIVAFENFQQLEFHIHQRYSPIFMLSTYFYEPNNKKFLSFARDLAVFLKYTSMLQNARRDLIRGYYEFPNELLNEQKISIQMLLDNINNHNDERRKQLLEKSHQADPLISQSFMNVFASIAEKAEDLYKKNLKEILQTKHLIPRHLRIQATLAQKLLTTLRTEKFPVLSHHLRLTPFSLCWHAYIHSL